MTIWWMKKWLRGVKWLREGTPQSVLLLTAESSELSQMTLVFRYVYIGKQWERNPLKCYDSQRSCLRRGAPERLSRSSVQYLVLG